MLKAELTNKSLSRQRLVLCRFFFRRVLGRSPNEVFMECIHKYTARGDCTSDSTVMDKPVHKWSARSVSAESGQATVWLSQRSAR